MLLAPFLIRIGLGAYFLYFAVTLLRREKESSSMAPASENEKRLLGAKKAYTQAIAWFSFIGGLSVLIGLYTQIGALILTVLSLWIMIKEHKEKRFLYFLLLVMSLSLFFSGAGFLAFDLPL